MQSHQPSQIFKSAEIPWPGIILTADRSGEKTSTTLAFNENMTRGLDPGYDAGVFKDGNDYYVYTQLPEDNGVDFGLQCLPLLDIESLEIPIGIDAAEGGEITFSLQQENLPVGVVPVLNDKLLQTKTAFTSENDIYTANINDNTSGYGRFALIFGNATNAVELQKTAFRAWYSNDKIIIFGPATPKTKVALYDAHGRKLMERKLQNTNRNEIAVQGFTNGIYFLRILRGMFRRRLKYRSPKVAGKWICEKLKKMNNQKLNTMKNKSNNQPIHSNNITRKEAIKKAGKYAAFTAAGMLMVLSPKESQAESPSNSPRAPRNW
jgi:hypothetical protein